MKRYAPAVLLWAFAALFICGITAEAKKEQGKAAEKEGTLPQEFLPGGIDLNIFYDSTTLHDIRVKNPPGYAEPTIAFFREIYVHYDKSSLSKPVKHFYTIRVDMPEATLIRDRNGNFNFKRLIEEVPQKGKEKAKKAQQTFRIDSLRLKIGKVVYKDYTASADQPFMVTLQLNIDDTMKNVTSSDQITRHLGSKILKSVKIKDVTNFDIVKTPKLIASAWAAIPDSTKEKWFGPVKDAEKDISKLTAGLLKDIKALTK